MSLGGSSPKAPKIPSVALDLANLQREAERMRQGLLPLLMEQFGFQMIRQPDGGIGNLPSYDVTKLPPSLQQQAIDQLGLTSLGGAQNAVEMMNQRLQMSQGMLPGLMSSVRASMAPSTRPPVPTPLGPLAGMGPLMPSLPPQAPAALAPPTTAPPGAGTTPTPATPPVVVPPGLFNDGDYRMVDYYQTTYGLSRDQATQYVLMLKLEPWNTAPPPTPAGR